ncbi:MAG: DMT family transporter [Clostridia bacterium]|nr:DMT family transporter [Clostridia bacterium]
MTVFFIRGLVTGKLNFTVEILPYAIRFATADCASAFFNLIAIQCGSLSLTSLIVSYSLMIPTLYGLIFNGDPVNIFFYIGLAFLLLSLLFVNRTSGGDVKITFKWLICVIIAFVGNGICSTVQPEQSNRFGNKYDDTFMVIALAIVFVTLLIFALIKDRKIFLPTVKTNVHLMVLCGLSNAVANLLVMAATGLGVNKSLMFPLISAGGIVIAWVVSVFLYKEKLSKKQHLGLALGVIAIVFLNITPTADKCCDCKDGAACNGSETAVVCCVCENEDKPDCCEGKEEACCTCENSTVSCSCKIEAATDQPIEAEAQGAE